MELDRLLHALLRNEAGVTDIEYALLGTLITMAILVSVSTLGLNLNELYDMVAGKVQDTTSGS